MIKNIKYKLSNKKSFTYMSYKVMQSKLFSIGLIFTASIIIIRHLPKEDYGLYVLMMAFFASFELFLGGFDASLIRFIPTNGKLKQHKLIATILAIKTVITVFILLSLFFLYHYSYQWLNISVDKLKEYRDLYMIISISFIFNYISTTISTLLTSFMMYDVLFKLTVIGGILAIANSIFIWQFSYGVVEWALVATIISFIMSLLNFYYLYNSKKISFLKVRSYINILDIKFTFKSQVLYYSLPLLGVSLLGYIKNYLPTYLFGTMVSLETLAVYSVFKQITDFLHKGYAGFLQSLYPKLFKMISNKNKSINVLFWIGLFIRTIIICILYFGYNTILELYDIEESNFNEIVFLTFLLIFFIRYFATYFTFLASSLKSTVNILVSSFTMFCISILILPVLYFQFNKYGLLMGSYLVIQLGTYVIVSQISKIMNIKIYYYIYIIISIVSLILVYNINFT